MPCSCDSSCRSRPSCSEPVPASPLPGGMRCRTLALGECGDGILPCNRSRMKKSGEKICGFQKWLYLCTRNTERGALVQLVRIRACHARGQGFESPTHRQREGQRRSYKSKSLVNEQFTRFFVFGLSARERKKQPVSGVQIGGLFPRAEPSTE